MKRVAEEMKACWNLGREEVIPASPTEGPTGAAQEHGTFGNWASSDENGANRSCAPASSPAQDFPGTGNYSSSPATNSSTPAAGWDARITEVMDREESASLTNPQAGWPNEDPYWPTTVGRCVHSDPIPTGGIGHTPARATRSDSDILTRALTCVGAGRVPAEDFLALAEQ